MSFTATTETLHDGERQLVVHWTGVADGTGNEDGAVKVDVSTLSPPATAVKVKKIKGSVEFGMVELYWDALVPVKFAELSGQIDLDFCSTSGLTNNKVEGATGDVLLSTTAFELNSTYDLTVEMIKRRK